MFHPKTYFIHGVLGVDNEHGQGNGYDKWKDKLTMRQKE